MRLRGVVGGLVLGVAGLVPSSPLGAQEIPADELKKEIESLREMLEEMRKDLREIKGILNRRYAPRTPVNALIDVGGRPFRGEQRANLTLVEYSDYQ